MCIKPDQHETFSHKGAALSKLGRYQEAIVAYDQALCIKPDKYEALTGKGYVLTNLGYYEESINTCDQAIIINPGYHEAWLQRGWRLLTPISLEYQSSILCLPPYKTGL